MKKYVLQFTVVCFVFSLLAGCDTQKPANEVKDAQERVKTKIETARENQNAENPEE